MNATGELRLVRGDSPPMTRAFFEALGTDWFLALALFCISSCDHGPRGEWVEFWRYEGHLREEEGLKKLPWRLGRDGFVDLKVVGPWRGGVA